LELRFALTGEIRVEALEDALRAVVRRHEVLRTGFLAVAEHGIIKVNGWANIQKLFGSGSTRLRPKVHFEARIVDENLNFDKVDLTRLEPLAQTLHMQDVTTETLTAPINYECPSLLRAVLFKHSEVHHSLLIGVPPFVFDAWSAKRFQQELEQFYEARAAGKHIRLPELSIQYRDYASWQRQRLTGTVLDRMAAYWEGVYGEPRHFTATDLCFARAASTAHMSAESQSVTLDAGVCDKVEVFFRREGITAYILFLAVISTLLRLCCIEERIAVGCFFSNRPHPDLRNLIGRFATHHLLVLDLRLDYSVFELLEHVKHCVLEATRNQELSCSMLHRLVYPRSPNVKHHAILRSAVTYEFISEAESSTSALKIRRTTSINDPADGPTKLRFLVFKGRSGQLSMTARYRPGTFENVHIASFLAMFQHILNTFLSTDSNTRLSTLVPEVDEHMRGMQLAQVRPRGANG